MKNKIEIVESKALHAKLLAEALRDADREEGEALGLDANKSTFFAYRNASYRQTAFINGQIAAMWGVIGTPLSMVGQPYLLTTHAVEKISPVKFTRLYKSEVEKMKQMFPRLENYVDARYNQSVRMLKIAGFKLSEIMLLGPNKTPFYKFTMESS